MVELKLYIINYVQKFISVIFSLFKYLKIALQFMQKTFPLKTNLQENYCIMQKLV